MKIKRKTVYVITCQYDDDEDYSEIWSELYDTLKEAKENLKEIKKVARGPWIFRTALIHRLKI